MQVKERPPAYQGAVAVSHPRLLELPRRSERLRLEVLADAFVLVEDLDRPEDLEPQAGAPDHVLLRELFEEVDDVALVVDLGLERDRAHLAEHRKRLPSGN